MILRRRPSTFRQRDISRAIRAARQAGEKGEVRVELDGSGNIVIISSREPAAKAEPENALDQWVASHAD
jgi:hypothetical protein